MADAPIAELTIVRTSANNDAYELRVAGAIVWSTRAYTTVVGRDGAKARMGRWLARNPHEVRMIGEAPPVTTSATDEQEIGFWREFEHVLGGRTWGKVEELLGKRIPRPNTLVGWNKLFEDVDRALKTQAAVA